MDLARTLTLLGLALFVTTGCMGGSAKSDEVKDELARNQYYEEAAKTYYEGKRFDQAVFMWDKVLVERPDDQWAKFGLAKSLQMVGNVESLRRAQVILEDIVTLEWEHPTRGNILFEVQGTLANVYSELADFYTRDLVELEAKAKETGGRGAGELQRQIQQQKVKRDGLLYKAMPLWQSALCQSPDNPYALAGLAKANLQGGSESAGIHYAERYIDLSRRSREGWKQKLREWEEMKQGQLKREERAFYMDKINGAREKEISMLILVGSVHMRREEFQSAIKRYNEVLALDPARVAALVERAQAYAGVGQYTLAVKDLEQYLKITDARKQREARINAAELLDRYRQILNRARTSQAAPTRR